MRPKFGYLGFSIAVIAPLALAACAMPPPSGPRVMALPGEGKGYQAFQQDDTTCRQYAYQVSGGQQQADAGTERAVGTAAIGTALGAVAGAALGSLSGQMGAGAAIGGVTGLALGGAAGASGAQSSYAGQQQQYDVTYTQCMYARGNTVQSPPPSVGYAGGYGGYGGYPLYGSGYYEPAPMAYGPSVIIGGGWGYGGGYHRGHGYRHRGHGWGY